MYQNSNVHLRWNNHQDTLVSVFDALLDNEKLTDCTIITDGRHLKAHKIILSACSPFFEKLFTENCEKHPIIILHDVKYDVVKALMDFMYRGEVNIPQDELSGVLKLSESLQIRGLFGSGHVDDVNTEKGSDSIESAVPLETLQSEPAAVSCFTSAQNQPEEKVQSFKGWSPTLSSQRGGPVGCDPISKSTRKYSNSVNHTGSNEETSQNMFQEARTPDLGGVCQHPSQRQVLPTEHNATGGPVLSSLPHQSVCSDLQRPLGEMTTGENKPFLVPEAVLSDKRSGKLSAHQQDASLEMKTEVLESHMEIVEDLTLDDDSDYRDDCNSVEEDIGEVISLCEGTTYEDNFLTQGNSSLHSQFGNEYLNEMSLATAKTILRSRFGCHCGKSYKNRDSLTRHKRECGKEPQFQCPVCNKRYPRSDNLRRHMAICHCRAI